MIINPIRNNHRSGVTVGLLKEEDEKEVIVTTAKNGAIKLQTTATFPTGLNVPKHPAALKNSISHAMYFFVKVEITTSFTCFLEQQHQP